MRPPLETGSDLLVQVALQLRQELRQVELLETKPGFSCLKWAVEKSPEEANLWGGIWGSKLLCCNCSAWRRMYDKVLVPLLVLQVYFLVFKCQCLNLAEDCGFSESITLIAKETSWFHLVPKCLSKYMNTGKKWSFCLYLCTEEFKITLFLSRIVTCLSASTAIRRTHTVCPFTGWQDMKMMQLKGQRNSGLRF